jgi:carboxyl-terminal processing protease
MPSIFFPKKNIPHTVLFLFSALIIVFSFVIGYFVGGARSTQNLIPESKGQTAIEDKVDFQQFWDVWNFAKTSYYKQPVSDEDLYYGALKGILEGLGDPYSVYFDPKDAEEFISSLNGSFSGIGAEIGIRDEKLVIVAPLDDAPAARAGIQPGDWIVMIDGVETLGMSVDEAVSKIRGDAGTQVKMSISRNGLDSLTEITITREKIVIDSVKWKIDESNIMRISISTFNDDTAELFLDAIQETLTKNVRGIILDLRSNPGGLLTSAIDVASAWIGYQPVVIEKAQENAQTFKGMSAARLADIPTVVLVNGGSASGSEIVAGALQDYGVAKLVGTQTFGKGSVQDYRELSDGSAVKVTTATWYTPKGRTIHETGITPDIVIQFAIEEFKKGIDPQLDVAIKVILGTYVEQKTENKTP